MNFAGRLSSASLHIYIRAREFRYEVRLNLIPAFHKIRRPNRRSSRARKKEEKKRGGRETRVYRRGRVIPKEKRRTLIIAVGGKIFSPRLYSRRNNGALSLALLESCAARARARERGELRHVFGEEWVASTRVDRCDVNAECTRWFCVLWWSKFNIATSDV